VSRFSIQFDVNRQDKGIINSYCLIEQMEKNLNTFSMRAKEWYGWHFPELAKLIADNETYVRLVNYIGNRENLSDDHLVDIEEMCGSGELAQKVLDTSGQSIGNELSEVDESSLKQFTQYVVDHFDYKNNLQGYLKEKMEIVAPNLTGLLGETMGAKLVNASSSLASLAKLPASTIQIMGAEKALFRALKKKGSTPKYGLLFNSSFISKAATKDKGKISRYLANKCALAARLDQHLINPTNRFGLAMKKQVDDRLTSLAEGKPTNKNQDVIEEVLQELRDDGLYVDAEISKKKKKKEKKVAKEKKDKKKKKAKKSVEMDEEELPAEEEEEEIEKPKKKKKKTKPE
jgi:nucleolar protein 56